MGFGENAAMRASLVARGVYSRTSADRQAQGYRMHCPLHSQVGHEGSSVSSLVTILID